MFIFGKRKITKQGGSCLISLPMQWMIDIGIDVKEVIVEMDSDKTLRITPVEPQPKTATVEVVANNPASSRCYPKGRGTMNPIHTKINRVNGHLLGTCAFFDGELILEIGAQNMDHVTFSVSVEAGKIILSPEAEK